MRHPLRSTLLLSLLYVAGMGVLNGCHEAADRQRVQTVRIPVGRSLKEESFYIKNGKHVLHGTQRLWFENGQLHRETEYVDGLPQGRMTEWYTNGRKAKEGAYQNGYPIGLWQEWDEKTGAKCREAVYDSECSSQQTFWYPDGSIAVIGAYRKGWKHGTWTYWNRDGTVKAEGEWRDGKPWQGMCGIPATGDAGSIGGILVFQEYRNGQPTEEEK